MNNQLEPNQRYLCSMLINLKIVSGNTIINKSALLEDDLKKRNKNGRRPQKKIKNQSRPQPQLKKQNLNWL